jgi:hypothetical protein
VKEFAKNLLKIFGGTMSRSGGNDMTIHWCGTGLSSVPGLRRLIGGGHKVVVWNRTVEKAREAVGDLTQDIRA